MIRLNDLYVRYGDLTALGGVSCTIDSGAVGLLGPNGAGKSTLLKTLLGFVRPSGGAVELFGHRMPEGRLEARRQLGYMPEREIVSPNISAVSFLTYCGRLTGMTGVDARERAHEVLNYVGMRDNRYRKMETYSTGMRQRVSFAQALIHDPKLLLLDEPTNGLDPEGRLEMLELVHELAVKRGVTVVLSSHLMPDVQHVCDRVVVLTKGKIVQDSRIDELTTQRRGYFEIRVRDNKEAFVAAIEQAGCTWRDQQNRNILVAKPEQMDTRVFFEIARAQRTHIRHFQPVRQSLEEAFMKAIAANKPLEDDAEQNNGN